MKHFNISNVLSFCRAPLALLFLPHITWLRFAVIVLAGLTDYLDGFLARRLHKESRVGAVLDPVMDKFFTLVVIGVLLFEQQIAVWEALSLLSRDLFLAAFIGFLAIKRTWRGVRCRSLWWGKVTTVGQYLILSLLVLAVPMPRFVFLLFPAAGLLYLGELILYYRQPN